MRLRDIIDLVESQGQDEIDEGLKSALKGAALGAAALASSNASAAPSKVDPEIVAASGDTARTRPVASKKDAAKKDAPAKKAVDPKAAAKKFHLDLK
jgi:hypothetical protein